ncbi:hypothetical protein [Stenotrophomonas maltophilia]|uniref:hypothetical protein n=1 Tax=Stenotrophomonas maltophilia TaxID=40324 RepID=UPI000C1468E2|nr:hypothetical protein [Stenotrophomonas maltophilia]
MRYGPARVVYSGDKERAQAFLPKGLQLLRNAQERQRLGGLNVLRDYQVLDDDSYCYVILGGGMAAVHIVAGYAPSVGEVEVERNVIPDFVSGVIRNGYIESASRWEGDSRRVLSQFHPTLRCAETYSLWGKKVQVPSYGYQEFERLAVEPLQGFPELRNPATSGQAAERVYSQYTLLRPTMYSGAMRGLVQALMGFGRQRRLPPAKDGQSRGREISLYEKIRSGPAQTDVDGGTPPSSRSTSTYLTEVANEGLQVRYDWKFYRTHGLTRAADGRWWLVEISGSAGVIAMPLPLHDATLSSTFRELLEQRGDVDALHLIEQFGGFPTGEPFPKAGSLESWIRAGRVVRLAARADLAEFYRHSPYSSDMGWAFNLRGDEAHNTAWRFGDDDLQRGVHYAISLQIGAVRPVKETADSPLLKRLERMRDAGLFPDRIDAAIWKAARMSAKQRALAIGTDEAVFRYVDALALEPIAVRHAHYNWLAGTAWHDGNSYSPYDCGDAADEGPWLSGGEHATSLAYSVPEPPLPVPVRELSPPGGEYEVWWISSSTLGQIRTHREEGLGFGLWATPSPTVDTNLTQYIEATYNCLGEATSARYGLNLNGGSRAVGVPQYPGMESRPLTYIGVIDGG